MWLSKCLNAIISSIHGSVRGLKVLIPSERGSVRGFKGYNPVRTCVSAKWFKYHNHVRTFLMQQEGIMIIPSERSSGKGFKSLKPVRMCMDQLSKRGPRFK